MNCQTENCNCDKNSFEWVTGQYHFQNRGKKEELTSSVSRYGYESAERFRQQIQQERKLSQAISL